MSQNGNDNILALVAHAAALLGWALFPLNFIIPIVIGCCTDSVFVKRHCRESLNFQISLILWTVVFFILCLVFVGIFGLIALAIAAVIMPIVAMVSAANGKEYRYPLTLRIL